MIFSSVNGKTVRIVKPCRCLFNFFRSTFSVDLASEPDLKAAAFLIATYSDRLAARLVFDLEDVLVAHLRALDEIRFDYF